MGMVEQLGYKLAITSQAASTLGVDPAWDAAINQYLRAFALWQADEEFGAKAKADNDWEWHRIAFEGQHGKNWRHAPEIAVDVAKAELASEAAEDIHHNAFVVPYWEALRGVAKTPAPTHAAACFKQLLIQAEEIWNDSAMDADCFELVAEDFARLAV